MANTRLVCINNYPDPLTKENNPHYQYGKHAYNILLEQEQNLIKSKVSKDFSLDNFEIININFHGNDDEQRFDPITEGRKRTRRKTQTEKTRTSRNVNFCKKY